MRGKVFSATKAVFFVAVVAISLGHKARAASFTEYNIPAGGSRPYSITAGPDGALWFSAGATIGRISTNGDASAFPLPSLPGPPRSPAIITSGSDGALWFTWEEGSDFPMGIGRISTQGIITLPFASGDSTGTPAVTSGPDGALWFSVPLTPRAGNGRIGRITTSGTSTTFPVPTPAYFSSGITAGPDGALWFTEGYWYNATTASQIVRMATDGTVTTGFTLPQVNGNYIVPLSLVTGPDGAIWFPGVEQIWRMTMSGVFTSYSTPTPGGADGFIAAGPDGALWFTETTANKIGRITTAGVITEYIVPTANSAPTGIATGPDGALWFTEIDANKIGRLLPTPSTIPAMVAFIHDPPPANSSQPSNSPPSLNNGEQTSLIAKLNAAQASMDNRNLMPACNQLDAFISQADDLLQSGQLTSIIANELIAGARLIEISFGCTP